MKINRIKEKYLLAKNDIAVSCRKGQIGITEKKREQKVIVSLTSHPGRIDAVHKTIITLLNQTVKPDYIILWLAEEQFDNKESDLPRRLLALKRNGLDIRWCKDIKSYKKLIPALIEYPNDIIITVDDDWYYDKQMVEMLLIEHELHPLDIISNRITHPVFNEDGDLISTDNIGWEGTADYLNKIVGSDGVLYFPNSLSEEVLSEDSFMKLAPTNDDIWFWAMAVKNGTKIRLPRNPINPYCMTDPQMQNLTSLGIYNQKNGTYSKTTNSIFDLYPDIKDKLLDIEENRNG